MSFLLQRTGGSPSFRPRTCRPVFIALLLCAIAGCATYTAKLSDLRPQLARGDHESALATIEKGTGGKDILLAWLERGMILRCAGRYAESNEAFAAAERTADHLYARSLSEGALSLFTNDLALSYRARPYELGLVPYYRALNYLALDDRESAMVEARKTSRLLARAVDATLAGIERGRDSDLSRTRNDPFMLYFSGMLYDWDGEWNDAFIAYRNAAVAYEDLHALLGLEVPGWLGWDLDRTGRWLGFIDELVQLREVCPAVYAAAAALSGDPSAFLAACPSERHGAFSPVAAGGEVVLFLETGFVPEKREWKLQLPIMKGDAYPDRSAWAWDLAGRAGGGTIISDAESVEYWLTVAVPRLQAHRSPIERVRVSAGTESAAFAVRAHHPAAVATITFEAEQPMILFKTALRGLSKYLATREARKQGRFMGVLSNIFGAATETADTRSWLTLPEQIHMVRLRLPDGAHDLTLEWQDGSGRPLVRTIIEDIVVRRGEWTFLSERMMP